MWRLVHSPGEVAEPDDRPRCYFGRCFALWAIDARLAGQTVWGFPNRVDTEEYVRGLEEVEHGRAHPDGLVVDFGGLVGMEPAGFEHLRTWLARHPESLHPGSVIVRPTGMLGAVVAGFHLTLGVTDKTVVTSVAEALARIGRDDSRSALAALDELRLRRASNADTIDRLRIMLEANDPPMGVAAAAKRLAVPARTLQDHLRRAGTSFRDEQARTRLARAKRFVRAGMKLTAVALEVGFSTPQQFATWFKRHVGVTPTEWRAHAEPE